MDEAVGVHHLDGDSGHTRALIVTPSDPCEIPNESGSESFPASHESVAHSGMKLLGGTVKLLKRSP